MKRQRPVLWFRVRDDRRRSWGVYLTTPTITMMLGRNSEGTEDHGTTDFEARRVYVNANKPPRTWRVTAAHELGHVALADTGFVAKEDFIEVHAVHFLPLIESLGFRFPPVPKLPWKKRG